MKIKCTNCGRTIAEGQKPEKELKITCPKCGVINDVSRDDKTRTFAERLGLEKK